MTHVDASELQEHMYPVFGPDSVPFGVTYAEWTARWWKWALSLPKGINPVCDKSGKDSARFQPNRDVWFLAGTVGGKIERVCNIPASKAILIPVSNFEASFSEFPNANTELELRQRAQQDIDQVTTLIVKIDGYRFRHSDLKSYRVESPLFEVNLPEDNLFDAPPGPTRAVSDGYWLFLKPLQKGKHQIYFMGSCKTDALRTEVLYQIDVV